MTPNRLIDPWMDQRRLVCRMRIPVSFGILFFFENPMFLALKRHVYLCDDKSIIKVVQHALKRKKHGN